MPIKKPAPDAIKKRDHAQSMPACSPRLKVILGLDNQHGIYRDPRPKCMDRLPFAIPVGIGSGGGKLSFVFPPLIGRGVPIADNLSFTER